MIDDDNPRWLDSRAAARYINVRPDALPRLVRQGRVPLPNYALGPRSPRWDRHAIDAMFSAAPNNSIDQVLDEIVRDFQAAKSRTRRKA